MYAQRPVRQVGSVTRGATRPTMPRYLAEGGPVRAWAAVRERVGAGGWLAVALAPLWPLLVGQVLLQHDVGLSDWLHSGLGYRVFLGRELAHGRFPLWMPDLLSGVPFLSQIEAGALYFPDWPLWALLDPTTATAVSVAVTVLVSAIGGRGLGRALGLSDAGATAAGLTYATAGFHLAHLKHHHMHAAAAWLPWALWMLERGLGDSALAWPLLSGVIAVQAYAGHPQISYYTGLLLVVRTVVDVVGRARADRRGAILNTASAAGSAALGGLLAAVVLLPTWRFNATSMRAGGLGWDAAAEFAFWPPDLLTLFVPWVTGTVYNLTWPGGESGALFWEDWMYLGVLPLTAAIVGLRRDVPGWARFWGLVAMFALLLMFGPHLRLFGWVWSAVPGMHLFRFPVRFLVVLTMAMALLAGRGLDAAVAQFPRLAAWTPLIFALHALDVTVASRLVIPAGPRARWDAPTSALSAAVQAPGRVSVVGGTAAWREAMARTPPQLPLSLDAMAPLARLPLQNAAVSFGWRTPDGYTNMVRNSTGQSWALLRNMVPGANHAPAIVDGAVTADHVALLERAGTTHLFAPEAVAVPDADRLATEDGWSVHALRHPAPRAYVDSPSSPAPVRELGPDALDVDATGPGTLVITDSYDPDWTARVDGAPAEITLVNGWQRAIRLGPGEHRVELTYWPSGFTAGLACGLVGALGGAAWIAAALRRITPVARR
jgi:hypothetical protein